MARPSSVSVPGGPSLVPNGPPVARPSSPGTIRRFLEHFGSGIDAVVLCPTDDMDVKAYETLLPQYFPRTQAELDYSRRFLPEDLGTGSARSVGVPVHCARLTVTCCTGWWTDGQATSLGSPCRRSARSASATCRARTSVRTLCSEAYTHISPAVVLTGAFIAWGWLARTAATALPAKSSLNQSVISDDDPLTTWADPNREPEAVKEEIVTSLTRVQGDHDEQRKVELVQKSPNGYAPVVGQPDPTVAGAVR